MDKIAVLIPCYNEGVTIAKVIADFRAALPEAVIYVYDNNSTDNTVETALKAGAVVRYERQQGKGFVIRRMFREIDAECYMLVDGDDTYSADRADEMCNCILNNQCDMVIGDRLSTTYYAENKRPFHNSGNDFIRIIISKLFTCNPADVLTGYRTFSYLFVKSFPVLSRGFEIETEMTIHAFRHHLNVDSVPVLYRDRPSGSFSKLNTFRDGIKVIGTIIRLFKNYKPLSFFSFAAVLLLLAAVIFFLPAIEAFIKGTVVPVPTLVISGFAALAAVQCFFSGLILSTINQKNEQDFEMRLVEVKHRLCIAIHE